jgi:glycosyltransferase involved in cell wall biosynthesis
VTAFTAADISVVIPTRNRWDILAMTLGSLRKQTVDGHEVVVVVNGYDQTPPPLPGVRVVQTEDAGPGAGRNIGAKASKRRLVVFLGDDTIPEPDLIERHVAAHNTFPAETDAILGLVQWHPEVAGNRINRWLDWSHTQFDYELIEDQVGQDVGFGRMFASNLSIKRQFFASVDGFDTDFYFGYEDLDLGLRLAKVGMRLIYQPDARVQHLHGYEWPAIARRFEGVAATERLMCHKHPQIDPFFLHRCQNFQSWRRALPVTALADSIPTGFGPIQKKIRAHANAVYYRRLAPEFIRRYDAAEALCDLVDYLDGAFTPAKLNGVRPLDADVDVIYPWTATAIACTHDPALALLREHVSTGQSVLDWAGRDGSDGISLIRSGFEVTFRDSDQLAAEYVRQRLCTHELTATIAEEKRLPAGVDAVLCLDQVESWPKAEDRLADLEARATVVVVSAPAVSESGMNADELVAHASGRGLLGRATDRSGRTVVAFRGARDPAS